MSDFDEEAERERLREQYEQEQQDRQATEKMSELLLQGATMTNAHCSDCGDPVFRYEGQEFCATCEKAIDRGDGAGEGAAEDGEGDVAGADDGSGGTDDEAPDRIPEDTEHVQVTPPDETRVRFGSGDADGVDEPGPEHGRDSAGEEPQDSPTRPSADAGGPQREPAPERVPSVDPSPGTADRGGASADRDAGTGGDSTLPGARASLERTLARLTRQAEAAEDPTQAREYLAAAREAAETLAALRQ